MWDSAFQVGVGNVGEGDAHRGGVESPVGATEVDGMGAEAGVDSVDSLVQAAAFAGFLEQRPLDPFAEA